MNLPRQNGVRSDSNSQRKVFKTLNFYVVIGGENANSRQSIDGRKRENHSRVK